MTKPPVACAKCGQPIRSGEVSRLVGHTATGPIHVHEGECAQSHREEVANTTACVECKQWFKKEADPRRPGRAKEYCSPKCRKAANRRRSRTWKAAATNDLPPTVDECAARRWAVTDLVNAIRSGRLNFNGAIPGHAQDLLIGYHRKLERHEQSLVDEQRRQREVEHAEAFKAEFERRTAAVQAANERFEKALLDADAD